MQISKISVAENRRLVPVKGWEGVTAALNIFANGGTRGSRDTERVTVDAIDKNHGGLASGFFLLGSQQIAGSNKIVDRFLAEAKERFGNLTQNEFQKSYDYDGMGSSFFKTTVSVAKIDMRPEHEIYGIGLYAAYVGDKPEIGLAEALQVKRMLTSASVEIEVEPTGPNRFEFDFEPVFRKVDGFLDTAKSYTGGQIARYFASVTTEDEDKGFGAWTFLYGSSDASEPLVVTLSLGKVESRLVHDRGSRKPRTTWSAEGDLFCGELARDYSSEDHDAKAKPTFIISAAHRIQRRFGGAHPIWEPALQERAIALANRIADALK